MSEGWSLLLRLGGAGIFVFVGITVAMGLSVRVDAPWLALAAYPVVLALAWLLFNEGLLRRLKRQSFEDHLREQEAKGKVLRERIVATRCLHFEDLGTGCDAYLLEVAGGGVLCIHGQYCFEPIDDDVEEGEEGSPRQFPRDAFDLLRKRSNGTVLDIDLLGKVFEPEHVTPRIEALHALGVDLNDGAMYPALSFDAVRAAALS